MNRGVYPGGARGNRRWLQPQFSGARYLALGTSGKTAWGNGQIDPPDFQYKVYDTEGYGDPRVPSRFTIPRDGFYRLGGTLAPPMGSGTTAYVYLTAYGKVRDGAAAQLNPPATQVAAQTRTELCAAGVGNVTYWAPSVVTTAFLKAGDFVQLEFQQQTGSTFSYPAWTVPGSDEATSVFWIRRLTLA